MRKSNPKDMAKGDANQLNSSHRIAYEWGRMDGLKEARAAREEGRPCEFDPVLNSASHEGSGCKNVTTLTVGHDGRWHLCESCAALPFFNPLRERSRSG